MLIQLLQPLFVNKKKSFLAIISLIAFDQGVKAIFVYQKKEMLINDSGIVSLPLPNNILIGLNILILGALGLYFFYSHFFKQSLPTSNSLNQAENKPIILTISLLLILAAGISNTIDRFVYGGVLDIFFIKTFALNIADIILLLGCAGIIYYWQTKPK